jgi:hypothetical protein
MKKISKCRISGDTNLISVLNLGDQYLTGVFPDSKDTKITKGPLELVWSPTSQLLQLAHSFDLGEMYGENYGYRSGLNQSMVTHLTNKIHGLEKLVNLQSGDSVIDIGSNDATSLKAYTTRGINRIGVDPTGEKFRSYYTDDIKLVVDFFPSNHVSSLLSGNRAKIISSIAMFYDLEDPVGFAQSISDFLHKDGVWHFEQSYMPSMIRMNSYDTICHEHLEFYTLFNIKYILDRADLRILDVQMNGVNGGSFAVTAVKKESKRKSNDILINWLLQEEIKMGFDSPKPFRDFENRVFQHRKSLKSLIDALTSDGKRVMGYGASTKGNVLLQFCDFTEKEISGIAEVNQDKYGCFTPGTNIPIFSEEDAKKMKPDYYFVLPWHFKDGIIRREQEFLSKGGKLIFPFPEIEIIGG